MLGPHVACFERFIIFHSYFAVAIYIYIYLYIYIYILYSFFIIVSCHSYVLVFCIRFSNAARKFLVIFYVSLLYTHLLCVFSLQATLTRYPYYEWDPIYEEVIFCVLYANQLVCKF